MNELRKKCKKTSIFWHFGPKWPILDSFWPKWAKREFFFKKALGTFFSHLQAVTAKFQKKVMNGFQETALHTNGQRDGRESLGL